MNIYQLTGAYKLLENAIALNPDDDELKEELAKINDDIEVKADKEQVMFVPIEGYGGRYSVSDKGEVRSAYRFVKAHGKIVKVNKPIILKQAKNKTGYLVVNLYNSEGKSKVCRVNRLVAQAFIPNPQKKRCVCHKDNNPLNNCVSNLYWGTDQENTIQAFNDGLCSSERPVCQLLNGNVVATYKSQQEASRQTGISQRNISSCVLGRRKSAGGFQWERIVTKEGDVE